MSSEERTRRMVADVKRNNKESARLRGTTPAALAKTNTTNGEASARRRMRASGSTAPAKKGFYIAKAVVDTDASYPYIVEYFPAKGATNVRVGTSIELTFNEQILFGDGYSEESFAIYLKSTAADDSDRVSVNISISYNKLIISPIADLASGTEISTGISSMAIKNETGNYFAGLFIPSYKFTTQAKA